MGVQDMCNANHDHTWASAGEPKCQFCKQCVSNTCERAKQWLSKREGLRPGVPSPVWLGRQVLKVETARFEMAYVRSFRPAVELRGVEMVCVEYGRREQHHEQG